MGLRRSKITCVLDFFLYLLFFGITGVIAYFLWTRVHWVLAVVLAFPIYRVIAYPIIFLTTPLFNWLTPENRAWSLWCKLAFPKEWNEHDCDRASRLREAIERWDAGGDCADLRECYKRIRGEGAERNGHRLRGVVDVVIRSSVLYLVITFLAPLLWRMNSNVAADNPIPSLVVIVLSVTGAGLLCLRHKTLIKGEERERCLIYVIEALTSTTAFWDRESNLFNNTLVKYLDSISEDAVAAREACEAANRLVQAAHEVIHRHDTLQPIPKAALAMHYAYSTLFLRTKDWAKSTLVAIEAQASGLTPHHEYVQHLRGQLESARREAYAKEGKLLTQLGLTDSEIEAKQRQVHSRLAAAEEDSWHPEPCTYELSSNTEGMRGI